MALLDFPNAIMWGVCMGLASFVPFIGPPAIIVMIGLVGLLTFDEWGRIVAVPALLTVVHFAESQYITPTFVSRRCALNTIAVFVTIAFLGWMWGAIGAIVAVPLLILISTVAAHLPSLRWLEVLLSDDRPVSERLVRPPLASVKRTQKPPRPAPVQRRRRVASK
jgi:predicted PurR-regulated permease PerM